jgi:hypothetical protein
VVSAIRKSLRRSPCATKNGRVNQAFPSSPRDPKGLMASQELPNDPLALPRPVLKSAGHTLNLPWARIPYTRHGSLRVQARHRGYPQIVCGSASWNGKGQETESQLQLRDTSDSKQRCKGDCHGNYPPEPPKSIVAPLVSTGQVAPPGFAHSRLWVAPKRSVGFFSGARFLPGGQANGTSGVTWFENGLINDQRAKVQCIFGWKKCTEDKGQ